MKKLLAARFILFLILFIAFALRFYQLDTNPPSLTWDEPAWGYNAYSLGIDGRDEFGRFLPYDYLESFGDFKPPLYAYLSIIPVKLFGLTEFATRFASAFFGTLTVLLTFFLTKAIFASRRTKQNSTLNHTETKSDHWILDIGHLKLDIAIVATAIMAISPWHIMLSRAAFEANVATFFIVAGVTTFLYWIDRRRSLFLILSVLSFALSLYTFNSARVVAPLLVMMLVIGFWKQLCMKKTDILVASLVGILLVLPLLPFLVSPQAGLRFKEVNIFTEARVVETANQEIANDGNAWWSKILHNRRLAYGQSFIRHYFDNLSFDFLFIKGDGNPKFSTQDVGQMYLLELPFFIAGLLFLFRKREGRWWIVPLWLVLAIIPAATARETPHALRIEATLPMFQILVAYGLVNIYALVIKLSGYKVIKWLPVVLIVGFLYFLNVVYFVHGYFGHYGWLYSNEWQYGYKESIAFAREQEKGFDNIVVTDGLGRPYAYYLFYMRISPEEFRKNAVVERDIFGFVNVSRVGKYSFVRNVNDSKSKDDGRVLYINDANKVPGEAKILKTFNLLNGEPVLAAYTLN